MGRIRDRVLRLAIAGALAACAPSGAVPVPSAQPSTGVATALAVPSPSTPTAPSPSPRTTATADATPFPTAAPPTAASPTAALPPTPAPIPGGTVNVPILYQHQVAPFPATWSAMTAAKRKTFLETDTLPWALEAQLDWLAARGYTTILPRDLAAWFEAGTPLPSKPVMLTFDDGFPDWVTTVLPLLRARGMTAEFYVTIDAVKDGRLPWDRVRELAAAGMGIGGHHVHHVQLASVGSATAPVSAATMAYEVTESRRLIAEQLGAPPDSMAYVGGGWNATLVAAVRAAGYTTARALTRGVTQVPASRWTLRVSRIGIFDDVFDENACVADPSVITCALRSPLTTFEARVTGADPG